MESMLGPFGAGLGPIGQSLLVPALAALVVAAGARRLAGRPGDGIAAGLGLGAGELAIAWAIGGAPALIRPAAVDKLVIVTLLFALLAAALLRRQRLEPRAVFGLAALAPVLWIAWPVLVNPDLAVVWRTALALAAALTVAVGIGRTEGAALPAVLPLAALGLAGVAFYGASFRMAQLLGGFAVGAMAAPLAVLVVGGIGAAGGLARIMLGAPFRAAAMAGLGAGASILLLYTTSLPLSLALLAPAVLASDLVRALPGGAGLSQTRHLLASATIALLSVVAAVGWAWLKSPEPYLG